LPYFHTTIPYPTKQAGCWLNLISQQFIFWGRKLSTP